MKYNIGTFFITTHIKKNTQILKTMYNNFTKKNYNFLIEIRKNNFEIKIETMNRFCL